MLRSMWDSTWEARLYVAWRAIPSPSHYRACLPTLLRSPPLVLSALPFSSLPPVAPIPFSLLPVPHPVSRSCSTGTQSPQRAALEDEQMGPPVDVQALDAAIRHHLLRKGMFDAARIFGEVR